MAQGYYEGYQAPDQGYSTPYSQPAPADGPPRAGLGRILNLTGAALSVMLVAGVAVWSYQLMVRDVTGVPVIRALGGPIRVSHDDPGGRQQQYQGLAVNSVAAEGAAPTSQHLVLAPAPIDLAPEDAPGVIRTGVEAPLAVVAAAPVIGSPAPLEPAPQIAALAPDALQPAALAPEPLALLPETVPGIARSPLPRARPGTGLAAPSGSAPLAQIAAAPAGTDPEAEALLQELVTRLGSPRAVDVDPTTLPPGTRLVQLGIYEDPESARIAWETMASRNPAWLDGRGRVIEPATSGGRVFYRLRALGFADEPEARRFCALFRAENLDCIPTLVR